MARKNISRGPMIQFSKRETPRIFVLLKTSPIFSYLTLAKGGYIIKISPMARGIFVEPLEKELIKEEEEGIKYPIPTPIAMARNIHSVRKRSKKPSFFLSAAGAQFVTDIRINISQYYDI
jgi:hypothetical protein